MNPDIDEAPAKGLGQPGLLGLGVLCGGGGLHPAIVITTSRPRYGRRWATARIPAGCDLGATASRRNAIAKAGVELGENGSVIPRPRESARCPSPSRPGIKSNCLLHYSL